MTSSDTPAPGAGPLTLTARSPTDLLALAPVVLGFFPSDSVVMLTFGAAAPFHARVDLPVDAAGVAEVVGLLVDPARRHGVRRVVLLVYGTDRVISRRLWRGLDRAFATAGIEVAQALRVEEERWYPLAGADPRARELGVPFDVSSHPFVVRAVVDGRVTHASRAALAATLTRDPAAVERLTALTRAVSPPADLLAEGSWLEATLLGQLEEGRLPDDGELARVLVALAHPGLRDAAWSVLTREHARASVAWWTHALTRCPEPLVPAPAALLAWAAWLHGNGALAWCALDRCEEAEPGYGLARIVADLLEQARPPSSWSEPIDWRAALAARTAPRAG
jgi:hypothetical protein